MKRNRIIDALFSIASYCNEKCLFDSCKECLLNEWCEFDDKGRLVIAVSSALASLMTVDLESNGVHNKQQEMEENADEHY